MSFTDLKVSDLRKVADTFAVELGTEKSKAVIIAQLEEEGITYQMYEKFLGAEKEEIEVPEVEKKKREKTLKTEDTMLVKMERQNHSYQTMGYTFSSEHPFVAMSTVDAQRIFDTEKGFRVATPREAQEYYA